MDGPEIPENSFVDGCVKPRKRGIKDNSSCETSPLTNKQKKLDKYEEVPPSPGDSSEGDGTSFGLILADGENEEEEEEEEVEETRVNYVSYGLISVIGRRRVLEDAVTVSVDGKINGYDLFAVYDGHCGAQASKSCRDRLHLLIAEAVEAKRETGGTGGGGESDYWNKVMSACFKKMDKEVRDGQMVGGAMAVRAAGSTALVVLVGKEDLVVANCGDSRAVLWRGDVAAPLSQDHKTDIPDEKERVEAAGGMVINWSGSRIVGVLDTSRSVGADGVDEYLKQFVTCEPEVTVTKRKTVDEFLIIASDGLWDVVSNEFACEVVRRCLSAKLITRRFPEEMNESGAAGAAALLAEVAMARGSKDNISIIVVELKKLSTSN